MFQLGTSESFMHKPTNDRYIVPILPVQGSSPECPLSENLKFRRPAPSGTRELPQRALDPGPTRRPRQPDSQFLESFRPQHPDPLTDANGVTPGRFRASRSRGGASDFQFLSFSGARKPNSMSTHRTIARTTHELPQSESISLPTSRDRPVSVRVWFGFGSISGGLIRCPRWVLKM
jgi:hypothetical protein